MEKTLQEEQQLIAKEAYFASLADWAKQAFLAQEAMAGFPNYLLSNYPQLFHPIHGRQHPGAVGLLIQPSPVEVPVAASARAIREPSGRARRIIRREGERLRSYEFLLAPIWKRTLAQAIDMLLMVLLKMAIAYALNSLFDIEKGFLWQVLVDDLVAVKFHRKTSTTARFVRTWLKIAGLFYEPLWTGYFHGATPGKWVMGIRIRPTLVVMPLQQVARPNLWKPQRVLIYPARRLKMRQATIRSLTKRLVTMFILPMSIKYFIHHNRMDYDVWTKTVVVEANSNTIFRAVDLNRRFPRQD